MKTPDPTLKIHKPTKENRLKAIVLMKEIWFKKKGIYIRIEGST